MRTYCAIIRDHSASMRSVVKGAINDYNVLLDGLKQSSIEENQEIITTVVECGIGATAKSEVKHNLSPISNYKDISTYPANGSGTPLFDSVGLAISELEKVVPDTNDAYLVMVITDGEENCSRMWTAYTLANKIRALQATDKWTFVFRVPVGQSIRLQNRLGIPSGNILEWEQSEKSLNYSSQQHVAATTQYFKSRSSGKTSTGTFYVDSGALTNSVVKKELTDVSASIKTLLVNNKDSGVAIKEFIINNGLTFNIGHAFYELTKRELVQDNKQIAVKNVDNGHIYTGPAARQLIGLPEYGNVKVAPANASSTNYKIFVQSNSVNRKLVGGTEVLYQI